MGKLTTHILDTAHGKPGNGILIELFALQDDKYELIHSCTSNDDGRTDAPMLEGEAFQRGKYQLVFHTASYFNSFQDHKRSISAKDFPFLDDIVIRFAIANEDEHYHVPLLCSSFSFSTYRGS